LVGDADKATVSAAIDRLWGGPETLIVISSDLSHSHDYDTATAQDGKTSQLIELGHGEKLTAQHA
jgi:AmmeMemoRadiSam system protein B